MAAREGARRRHRSIRADLGLSSRTTHRLNGPNGRARRSLCRGGASPSYALGLAVPLPPGMAGEGADAWARSGVRDVDPSWEMRQ